MEVVVLCALAFECWVEASYVNLLRRNIDLDFLRACNEGIAVEKRENFLLGRTSFADGATV